MTADNKITWFKTGSTTWATHMTHRGYTGGISYTAGVGYALTITGSGAPAPATYDTLHLAKNAFRKFLFTKP